jgi:hypothetical protein
VAARRSASACPVCKCVRVLQCVSARALHACASKQVHRCVAMRSHMQRCACALCVYVCVRSYERANVCVCIKLARACVHVSVHVLVRVVCCAVKNVRLVVRASTNAPISVVDLSEKHPPARPFYHLGTQIHPRAPTQLLPRHRAQVWRRRPSKTGPADQPWVLCRSPPAHRYQTACHAPWP